MTAMASALFETKRLCGEGRMALCWYGYQRGTRNICVVQRASAGGSKPVFMQILMNVHWERSTGPHTDVHGQVCMWIQASRRACTRRQWAERSQYILCVGGGQGFLKAICCLLLRRKIHTYTCTRTHAHTYTRCPINPKKTRATVFFLNKPEIGCSSSRAQWNIQRSHILKVMVLCDVTSVWEQSVSLQWVIIEEKQPRIVTSYWY